MSTYSWLSNVVYILSLIPLVSRNNLISSKSPTPVWLCFTSISSQAAKILSQSSTSNFTIHLSVSEHGAIFQVHGSLKKAHGQAE